MFVSPDTIGEQTLGRRGLCDASGEWRVPLAVDTARHWHAPASDTLKNHSLVATHLLGALLIWRFIYLLRRHGSPLPVLLRRAGH